MTDPTRWTTASDVRATVRRRWDDGTLLRAFARDDPFPAIDVPLRGPTAGDLGDHYDAARSWADELRRGSRNGLAYEVVEGVTGGRLAGRTALPQRAMLIEYEQAWMLLGTGAEAATYRRMVQSASTVPAAGDWATVHPVRAIGLSAEWQPIVAAYRWLDAHRGSGLYVRQVNAPGVDTKLIERHRTVLAEMLGVPASGFARALGLAQKPATVRLRFDPAGFGLAVGVGEATFRAEELRNWHATPTSALIVENEISYLRVPIPTGGVVLWGRGFDVEEAASLGWLAETSVTYWGDLDTHGFAILNRVRARLPQARSVLMDRETLLAHEERWGREPKPTAAALPRLTGDEAALYSDLVSDRYASAVRLEQERIDWAWVLGRVEG